MSTTKDLEFIEQGKKELVSVKRKLDFGKAGNKEYMTLGFIDDEGILDEIKELWEETTCKPKLITYQQAIDNGWVSEGFVKNTDARIYKIFSKEYTEEHELLIYKMWFLAWDIKKIGLWSPPNAVLRNQQGNPNLHFHPGGNRVRALSHIEAWDTKFVIWDPCNICEEKELSFDEWLSLFEYDNDNRDDKNNVWFSRVRKFIGDPDELFMLEAHISQGFSAFENYQTIMREYFNNTKPKLINYHDEELSEYVHFDGDSHGVEIYVKDGQSFTRDDLDLLVNINPDNKTFENEKVKITVL